MYGTQLLQQERAKASEKRFFSNLHSGASSTPSEPTGNAFRDRKSNNTSNGGDEVTSSSSRLSLFSPDGLEDTPEDKRKRQRFSKRDRDASNKNRLRHNVVDLSHSSEKKKKRSDKNFRRGGSDDDDGDEFSDSEDSLSSGDDEDSEGIIDLNFVYNTFFYTRSSYDK